MAGTATIHAHHWHLPATTTLRLGWPRKLAAGVMVLIGGTFVAVTLIANLFSVGPAFDRLTDGFRPIMTQQQIATYQQDVQGMAAAGSEISTKLMPQLPQLLNMTPAQVNQMMGQYPAVEKGLATIPAAEKAFTPLLQNLDKTQPLFVSADAIPTKSIPAASVPWSLFAVGLIAIGLGVLVWFSPKVRAPIIATVVGAALIALPLSMNMVTKASNADQMNANLKPVYNQALIDQSKTTLNTLGAMGADMNKMMTALAQKMQVDPQQLPSLLKQQGLPATAAMLTAFPSTLDRFNGMVSQFDKHLSDYKILKPVSFEPIVWFMIGGGIALFLLGSAGIVICRSKRASE
jgi:hypothetical protein